KSLIKNYILIDGAIAGTLEAQETKDIEVTPGTHVVEILGDPLIKRGYRTNIAVIKIIQLDPDEKKLCEIVTPSKFTIMIIDNIVITVIILVFLISFISSFEQYSYFVDQLITFFNPYFIFQTNSLTSSIDSLELESTVRLYTSILLFAPLFLLFIYQFILGSLFGFCTYKPIFKEDMLRFHQKK
ncbi:MAG: hypothetical protein K2X66_06155, partial [Cyanobacteria bacterium]|nr:hypothetical protein [Cyanobacteriota bacterium]